MGIGDASVSEHVGAGHVLCSADGAAALKVDKVLGIVGRTRVHPPKLEQHWPEGQHKPLDAPHEPPRGAKPRH